MNRFFIFSAFALLLVVIGAVYFVFSDSVLSESSVNSARVYDFGSWFRQFFLKFTSRKPQPSSSVGLGNFCRGEEGCNLFCKNNFGRCKAYCRTHPQNILCQKPFAFELPPVGDVQLAPEEKRQPPPSSFQPSFQLQPEGRVSGEKVQSEKAGCQGKGPVEFVFAPMRVEDISFIIPLGQMAGGHVTPTDHGYYHTFGWKPHELNPATFKDVLAPADGVVTSIGLVGGRLGDYRIVLHHTCTFSSIYIHVRELSPKILQATGEITDHAYPLIPVKAGEVIGRAPGFDFSVHNDEVVLKGFVVPQHYDVESWKVHTVDMFDPFRQPLKSQLLKRNVRQAEPQGGKIDYDVDGRLVGNWFEEKTGGYRGGGYGGAEPYWSTHLSIVYNHLDPSLIMISIGNMEGKPQQFAVKDNAPDPASVSVSSGLIKYELVDFDYLTDEGRSWDRTSFAKISKAVPFGQVAGVVLVQMIEDRKITFEAFPGKTAAEIEGFTEKAKIYER